MKNLAKAKAAMAHVTCTTPFGSGSLVYRTLARAWYELEERFGNDADLDRFLRDLQHAVEEARGLLAGLEEI